MNRARKTAGQDVRRGFGVLADLVGRGVQRDDRRQAEHDQQDDEPDAQEVVAELLGRDDAPAAVRHAQLATRLRGRLGATPSVGTVVALIRASVRRRAGRTRGA